MNKRNIVLIGAVAVLLAACIPSVNPFYTEKDVVFESRLVGTWQEKEKAEEPQSWMFEEGKDKAYKLTVTEKEGKQGEFEAHLFKLKGEFFLDIVATEIGTNISDTVAISLIPGHLLFRVQQIEPELKMGGLNFSWLDNFLKEHPKALAHHRDDHDRVFLTAETADLQSFVLKHLKEGELFDKDVGVMVRKEKPIKEPAANK